MSLKQMPIERAFTWLESGPVTLVTTNDGENDNVMTISWLMPRDFEPHIAISTGSWNESFETILTTRECCVCVPPADLLGKVVAMGVVHGSQVDKFEGFKLAKAQAEDVAAPLVEDCCACIECVLEDYVAEHGLLILRGVRLWENPDLAGERLAHANGDGTFFLDGELVRKHRATMRKWVPEGCERL